MRADFRKYFTGVRLTIIKTIGITILLFLCGFLCFQYINNEQIKITRKNQDHDLAMSFNSILRLKAEFYESILVDYACFDWMVQFIKRPQYYDAPANITTSRQLNLAVFQVHNLNDRCVYVDNSGLMWRDTLHFNGKFFWKLKVKRHLNFFLKIPEGVLEIYASTVQGSDDFDKKTPPGGYLIIGKLWSKKYLDELSTILNARLSVVYENPPQDKIIFSMKGINNKPQAYLVYEKHNLFEESLNKLKDYLNMLFVFLCLCLLLLTLNTYEHVVVKPLSCIEKALDQQSPQFLERIIRNKNEFSKIAILIVNYFSQKELTTTKLSELQKAKDELKFLYSTLLSQKSEIELQKEELKANGENLAIANEQILRQKFIVEEQNQQITDSMVYASMIQNAVLIPQFNLDAVFQGQFIMYQPKGIVSGDFYWFKENKKKYFFACADCTGHGLSGALMSMLGISNLNEVVLNFDPGKMDAASVLNAMRNNIVNTLHQTGEVGEIHDGMDIVFCIYDSIAGTLDFAAAYNPLFHVTKDVDGQDVLVEYRGDNMPVGIHDRTDPFSNKRIELKRGDSIYLFTDGYVDQFGDQGRKKFNKNNFKSLVLSVQDMSMGKQKEAFVQRFNDWKKDVEQIDDVTVIGIKF